MVTKLQLEIDSTVHRFLTERATQDGVSVEDLILRLIQRYKREIDKPGIVIRKVWDDPPFGRPSPDGRYLSMTNWETGNLAVRECTTGESRDVTKDAQTDHNMPRRRRASLFSIWSPDGKQLAYQWFNEGYLELRIIALDGGKPRVLWHDDDDEFLHGIEPYNWSADGKSIVCGGNKVDDTSEILLISVADGSVRTLKSLKSTCRNTSNLLWGHKFMSLSPDGRYGVYSNVKEEDGYFRDLFLMALDGSGEEIHLNTPPDGHALFPMWAPDGKTIVFACNQTIGVGFNKLIRGLWLIHVIDGKQVGEPQLVTRVDGEPVLRGFTRDGCLYYGINSGLHSSGINVVSLDMETGELLSQPMPLRSDGHNTGPVWSPDGNKLAYMSTRIYWEGTENRTKSVLVLRSMETGEEREIVPEPQILLRELFGWSPDGRAILFGYGRPIGIYLIDTQTGEITTEITTAVEGHLRISPWDAVWSRDGKTIYYTRTLEERGEQHGSIMAHNLATGEEQELELCPGKGASSYLIVSPDGRQLVSTDIERKVLKVVPTAGGETRIILNLHNSSGESVRSIRWMEDGHHVLAWRHKKSPDNSAAWTDGCREIWRIPVEGGEPEKLWELKEPLIDELQLHDIYELHDLFWRGSIHPDGQRRAYSTRIGGPVQSELWVMENLLTTFSPEK